MENVSYTHSLQMGMDENTFKSDTLNRTKHLVLVPAVETILLNSLS